MGYSKRQFVTAAFEVYVDWGFGGCEGVDDRFSSFDALTEWLLVEGP